MSRRGTRTRIGAHKLFAPPGIPGAIHRRAILDRVLADGTARAVVIQGPAGHGKSTLLQQLKAAHDAEDGLTGWLTLDEADNDANRFFASLQALLEGLSVPFADPPPGELRTSKGHLPAADWFIDSLMSLDVPVALFFDEFQTLTNKAALRLFRNLLEYLPERHKIYIGSRTVPDIGLARMVVNHQALLLRAEDLRFSRDEVEHFFAQASELSVSGEELAAIYEKTEGWPAALQLYRLSLARPAVRESLGNLALFRPRQLAEYLADNVLSLQTPEVQDFLLLTAPLRRLSAPLCDAVLERGDSQEILASLEQSGLFLRSLDAGMQWFSYHTLFSSFLVEQLRDQDPEAMERTHRAAARWVLAHGHFEEAMHHGLATRDVAFAAECLDQWATQLVMDGNLATVEYWYDRLPLDEIETHPELVIKIAWALAFLRRRQKLQPVLRLLEKQRTSQADGGEAREDVVLSMVAIIDDDIPKAFEIVRPVNARDMDAQGFRAFELGAAANLKGYLELVTGDFERAREYLVLARTHGDRANAGFSWGYSIGTAGFNLLCQGQLHEALELVRASLSQPRVLLDDSVASAVLVACHIYLLYEINDLAAAKRQFSRFQDVIANAALHDYLVSAYFAIARIHDAEAQPLKALAVLEEVEGISHASGWPRLTRLIAWERVRRAVVCGEMDRAHSIASRIPDEARLLRDDWIPFSECVDGELINRIRLDIHDQRPDPALRTIGIELARAASVNRVRRQIKLFVLEALAYQCKGIGGSASRSLRSALQLAAPRGFVRIFLDEGPALMELLSQEQRGLAGRAGSAKSPEDALLLKLLEACGKEFESMGTVPGDTFPPLEPLSGREESILQLLARGLSNREIAASIHVSENTVKFHLKNVYSKLGVNNRLQAITAARELRLL